MKLGLNFGYTNLNVNIDFAELQIIRVEMEKGQVRVFSAQIQSDLFHGTSICSPSVVYDPTLISQCQ